MDATTLQTAAAIGVPIAGVVIWLLRLEGRVNTHGELHKQLREDVTYIRERIDRAINGKH